MKENVFQFLLLFSLLGNGLSAGVYFIFSNTIMAALKNLKPHEGVSAMRQINRVILNGLFFLIFFGTALSSLALIILLFVWRWPHQGSHYIFLGSSCYLLGCFLVTIIFNVPRNEALDAADPTSPDAQNFWSRYLIEWTAWNHVRTVACVLATTFFFLYLS
ncbi:MAG: DUF1772 domain-containing protein [Candidatus Omnitrophica bacterium]|nr:DUF1772 domain-containing protein [Candidatus Omnitrophota bacterium]